MARRRDPEGNRPANRKRRISSKAKHRPPRRRPGRKLLPWLVLGGVGLVAALWRRGEAPVAHRHRRGIAEGLDDAGPEASSFGFAPPPHAQESWVAAPAGSIRLLEVHPEAPLAVVFVHGLAGRLEHWMPQLAAAGPGMRAIAFDLPGHGGSDAPATTDVASLSSAIAAVLDSGLSLARAPEGVPTRSGASSAR